MTNVFKKSWAELRKKLTDEQVLYLFILLLFLCSKGYRLIKFENSTVISEKSFDDIIKQENLASEMKESYKRISTRLDRHTINNGDNIRRTLHWVQSHLLDSLWNTHDSGNDSKCGRNKLGLLFEDILELAGKGGVFVDTPDSIKHLIEEMMSEAELHNIADFCCGSGTLGLNLWKRNIEKDLITSLYFTDADSIACDVAKINLYMHGISTGEVNQRDLLSPLKDSKRKQFDLLVMDIPRGRNSNQLYEYYDVRIGDFNKKSIYSDWLFIQDALYHLNEHGYAIVLATTSALIRSNEMTLREQIIKKDWLETVITLPSNLYRNTRTGTELLIFNKSKCSDRRGKVLFIDISKYYYRSQRNAYSVSEEGREYACDSFLNYREIEGISTIQEISKMDLNNCSFKPIQYIQQKEELYNKGTKRLGEISQIIRGSQITGSNKDCEEGSAYFINIKDIQNNRVLYDTADKIRSDHQAHKGKFQICEDDILITSKGTAIKVAIVETNPPLAFVSGNITIIRVDKSKYDPYILFEYLDSKSGRIALERIQSGTTIRILNNGNLQNLKIPEYSLDWMQKVGSQLKENYNAFLKAQKMLIDDYEKKKKTLLSLLFKEA